MNARTEVQIIHGQDGTPAFAEVPYADWLVICDKEYSLVPNEVVNFVFDNEWTPMRS